MWYNQLREAVNFTGSTIMIVPVRSSRTQVAKDGRISTIGRRQLFVLFYGFFPTVYF